VVFDSASGCGKAVTPEAFGQTLDAAGASVRLIVLNACHTASIAEALLAHVDCVVGMSGAIHDDAARSFAIGFYGGLGEYESIAAAFRQGRAAIHLDSVPEADRPQLQVRDDFDAAQLILAAVAPSVLVVTPCPYSGMRPFAADDAGSFHGREAEITDLLGRLRAGQREIFVIGPLGFGKSSLVAAGSCHGSCVGSPGSGRLSYESCVPATSRSRGSARRSRHRASSRSRRRRGSPRCSPIARPEPRRWSSSISSRNYSRRRAPRSARVSSTPCALRAEPRCAVIFTLRADFSGALMESSLWPERPAQLVRVDVSPLRGQALREAIAVPANDAV
jgi:hypothetical protein